MSQPCKGLVTAPTAVQKEAAKLYAAEVYQDMLGRHKGRAERGRSGATTYNAQVLRVTVTCTQPFIACLFSSLLHSGSSVIGLSTDTDFNAHLY